jgi:hypothetical protein
MVRPRWKVVIATVIVVLLPFILWLGATAAHEPWRRWRVRLALSHAATWDQAILAAEEAAAPSSAPFAASCSDNTRIIVAFDRTAEKYSVVRLVPAGDYLSRVSPDGYRWFPNRGAWSVALRKLGPEIRCQSLRVLLPGPHLIDAQLDTSGHVAPVEEP